MYNRLLISFLLCTSFSFAQNTSEVQSNWNRIFAKHFTSLQLEQTYENAPEVYEAINFYFKESFTAEITGCEGCNIDIEDLLNNKIFDVYLHESMRLDEINFSFEYKDLTITLHPKNVVYSQLEGLSPSELVDYIAPRSFPTFELTNDDEAEYADYKERVYAWAKDFPEQYRAMTNSDGLLKISIRDFINMSEEKKSAVLNHPTGYLIIN